MNIITIEGRLTRDAELKYTGGGTAVSSFSAASNDWNGKEDHVSFFNCSLFGKRAESLNQYLSKGQAVFIIGNMRQDRWTDKDGNNRNTFQVGVKDIKLLGGKPSEVSESSTGQGFSDDIPF